MRIRKRLALSAIPTAAFSDLHLQRSEAAPPPDQPSDPPKQPSDQSMAVHSKDNGWVFPKTEEKMKQKEFLDDETLRVEAKKTSNNDIRKIVNICNGGEDFNKSLQPSSSSIQESCCEGGYMVVPLKKRKGSTFERNPDEEKMSAKMKSKTNKKCGDTLHVDQKPVIEETGTNNSSSSLGKKGKSGNVIMEGSRCSRVNGRGWRCCQPTLVGYSLCEHHLGKGRLRSMANVRRGAGAVGPPPQRPSDGDSRQQQPLMMVTKKRTKVGVVKARSMSSLLSQIESNVVHGNNDSYRLIANGCRK